MKTRQLFTSLLLSVTVLLHVHCSKSDVSPATANTANLKSVGESARELLTADKPNIILEINYMPGYQIDGNTLNALKSFIATYSRKSGISVIQKQIPASGKDSLKLNEIADIEKDNRTSYNTSDAVAVYLLVTDSRFSPNNTLGAAYRNTSIVLFGKTIHQFSGGVNQVSRYKLETTTLDHEIGHLFGLVNVGTPMQTPHEDAAHRAHCNNNKCLMYFETESTGMIGGLINNAIPALDAQCEADLTANGGR